MAAAAVFEAIRLQSEQPEFTLSNGVVIRTRAVSREAVRRALLAVRLPSPPNVWIEAKQRNEVNPNDPSYIDALAEAHKARLSAVQRVLLALGVEIVSVPDDMDGPDTDEWWQRLEATGITIRHDSPVMRQLEWLEMVALNNTMDAALTFARAAATYGLFEEEVRASVEFFRLYKGRRSDLAGAAAEAVQ